MKPLTRNGKTVCPKGTILVKRRGYTRTGYIRKDGCKVSSSRVPGSTFCITDRGKPGKGKPVIPVISLRESKKMGRPKGFLRFHGYKAKNSSTQRHKALDKAVKDYGAAAVWRKLHALTTLHKNKPQMANLFRSDREYIKEKHTPDFTRGKKKKRGS